MRSTGYKCYNIKCGSCMGKTLCGETGDAALSCADRLVNVPTNGDRIRAMTDEDLAAALSILTKNEICLNPSEAICDSCLFSLFCGECPQGGELEWLKQPAEDA